MLSGMEDHGGFSRTISQKNVSTFKSPLIYESVLINTDNDVSGMADYSMSAGYT